MSNAETNTASPNKAYNIVLTLVAQVPAPVIIAVLTLTPDQRPFALGIAGLVGAGALIACLVWASPRARILSSVLVVALIAAGAVVWLGVRPPPPPVLTFPEEPGICRPVRAQGQVQAGMELWVGVQAQSSDSIYFQGPMTQVTTDDFRKVVALGDPVTGAGQLFTLYVIEIDAEWANYLTTTDVQDLNRQTWISKRFPPGYTLVGSHQVQRSDSTVNNC